MNITLDQHSTPLATTRIPQLRPASILGVWAAAAAPMAVAAWVAAPRLADSLGTLGLLKGLLITLTAGLIWQFVLVLGLVGVEQRSLRWSTLRQALWLQAPQSPKTGRRGGRLWLLTLPFIILYAVGELIPALPHPSDRDLGLTLESDAGQAFFSGNWGWFALAVVLFVFNTALGEELLFRGYLLPRMQGVFAHRAWLANGVLFAFYHLHVPWVIPAVLVIDTVAVAYPTQRYRSAWIGIIVHSAQTVFFTLALLAVVLK